MSGNQSYGTEKQIVAAEIARQIVSQQLHLGLGMEIVGKRTLSGPKTGPQDGVKFLEPILNEWLKVKLGFCRKKSC
jgi:hypothetical protein